MFGNKIGQSNLLEEEHHAFQDFIALKKVGFPDFIE
jgi:hypothetical protein